MYSYHVQLPCTATMYSSHVQLPCTATHHNYTAIYHVYPTVGSVKEGSQKKVQYALKHGQCIVTDVCVRVTGYLCIARRIMHAEKVFSFMDLAHTI